MLLGFPLAWFIFLLLEMALYTILMFSGIEKHLHWTASPSFTDVLMVLTSAAWMGPIDEKWVVPVAFVVLLIPSFALSGYVESKLPGQRGWLRCEVRCAGAVWQANVLSYLFLAIAGCVALARYVARL